ncbi:MAG: HepT-like ribonuclease domain-containing protein [Patescibacteria group bacterium]
MKTDELFVRHMIDAIDEIQKVLGDRTFREFVSDPLRMHACVRLFEILGEAAGKLTTEYRQLYRDIPFADIIGMRNKLIHHYFEVDLEILWKAYEEDLPALRKALKASLKTL